MPRFALRIALVEVGEKQRVGEMLETRGVVAHPVGVSREVEGGVTVSVKALVAAGVVAKKGGGAVAGDGAASDTRHRRSVVRAVGDRGVGDIMRCGDQRDLPKETGMFQVAVGDPPSGVVGGYQVALDVFREG